MNPLELQIHRDNTAAFIAADPVTLLLRRKVKVPIADGGYSSSWVPLFDTEVFRLIPLSDINPQVQTIDGVQLVTTYVLLGTWDADMKRGDRFTLNGADFQIVSPIRPEHTVDSRYEKKGDVARL